MYDYNSFVINKTALNEHFPMHKQWEVKMLLQAELKEELLTLRVMTEALRGYL